MPLDSDCGGESSESMAGSSREGASRRGVSFFICCRSPEMFAVGTVLERIDGGSYGAKDVVIQFTPVDCFWGGVGSLLETSGSRLRANIPLNHPSEQVRRGPRSSQKPR